mgnify:CR=1 FL=1
MVGNIKRWVENVFVMEVKYYLKKFGIQTKAVLACISVLTLETMTQDAFDKIEIEILKLLNY